MKRTDKMMGRLEVAVGGGKYESYDCEIVEVPGGFSLKLPKDIEFEPMPGFGSYITQVKVDEYGCYYFELPPARVKRPERHHHRPARKV